MGDEEEEADTTEAADLKSEKAVVGVAKEAAEDEVKEIDIKVKMGLTSAIPQGGMGNKNGCNSATILNNVY